MPTGCQQSDFARIAGAAGYVRSEKLESMEALDQIAEAMMKENGPILFEIPVSLDARADLGRPKESARENKEEFMKFLSGE